MILRAAMSTIVDGKLIADKIKEQLKLRISKYTHLNVKPTLAVIMVGDRKDSETYVRMKKQAAEQLGINFLLYKHDTTISQQQLLNEIDNLNNDNDVDGIIVQMPVPNHIDKRQIISHISVNKDVDGFHGLNIGNLALEGHEPLFIPCTPRGVMEILKHYNVQVKGKHVVVLGKSNIVGLPMSLMLLNELATVTVCHSETVDEEKITRTADILISAVGKPHLVKADWVKDGAVVIDIGINPIIDSTKKTGYRIVGDVDFEEVKKKTSLITPVPGGVGVMTVCMLMSATVESFERKIRNKT
jgi:5,10-methylene-tetrahydrofolate dehydrogenase/methenyl tetrahydrofolate cyclohydrolase